MISVGYVAQNLRGVWQMVFQGEGRLAGEQEDWGKNLDFSLEGVFNSFWAIALSAPLALLSFAAAKRAVIETPQTGESIFSKFPFELLLISELAALVVYWAASIAALVITARAINASHKIAGLIVAFNWSQLLGYLCIVIPAALYGITGSVNLYALAVFPVLILNLMILWGVLRNCLPLTIGMTLLFIALLAIIQIIISELVISGMIGLYQLFS